MSYSLTIDGNCVIFESEKDYLALRLEYLQVKEVAISVPSFINYLKNEVYDTNRHKVESIVPMELSPQDYSPDPQYIYRYSTGTFNDSNGGTDVSTNSGPTIATNRVITWTEPMMCIPFHNLDNKEQQAPPVEPPGAPGGGPPGGGGPPPPPKPKPSRFDLLDL